MSDANIDPATLSVIWHGLNTTAKEMTELIRRTCRNYITVQLNDHYTGLYDAEGRLVASHSALPPIAGTGEFQVRDILATYGAEVYPGDRFMMNCSYTAHGTHLPDWTFVSPVFHKGVLSFWALVKAHQMDTSGDFPGGYFPNAYDIHAEGLAIPPTKIVEKGKLRKDVYNLIMNNVRYREDQRLDHSAMYAALEICGKRLEGILEKYGRDTLYRYIETMFDRMEAAVRQEIAKIPDGRYYGDAAGDEDGTTHDKPVWVRCEIEIKGDSAIVDWSKSDKQCNFVNSPIANTYSYSCNAIFCCLADPDLADFHNHGSYRPITVVAPKGSVTNPEYPATVGGCPVSVGHQMLEAVFMAMAAADPTKGSAGWAKHMSFDDFGVNRRNRQYWVAHFNANGGSGAIWGYDGWPNLSSVGSLGCQLKANIEATEARYPWKVLRWEMRTDAEGAGRWRGGPGTHVHWVSECEGREHAFVTGGADGFLVDHHAVAGGQISPRNQQWLIRAKTGQKEMVPAKRGPFFLEHGDQFVQLSRGGAGVGDPAERDPEKVRWDVLNELVSPERAQQVYKVVIAPDTFEIDQEATARLRASSQGGV